MAAHGILFDLCDTQLILIIFILQSRQPYGFEILDGAVACVYQQMDLFLERVKAFPEFCFVVVNVHRLESKVLEKLMSFLSNHEIALLGIKFHCIQRGETLHTAPWISERSWDSESIATQRSILPSRNWVSSVFAELTVISHDLCGTGKTRHIREQLKSARAQAQVASIVLHEKSSVGSLIRSLKSKFQGTFQTRLLHISIACLPQKNDNYTEWLQQMNYFFFCMLALQSVYDPVTTTSFVFAGKWSVLVEMCCLPSGESSQEWLQANIPILGFYSRFQAPECKYIIDDNARRVCTYLRALHKGTINRKYHANALKRIILVLDCSGSMQGDPFRDAVRNAVCIFDSHVVEGDVIETG